MLFPAGLIASVSGGVSPPTFGTGTSATIAPNAPTQTNAGHTSAGGDLAVRMIGRCVTASLATLEVTWNGVALVERIKVIAPRAGGAFCWIGTIKGGATGNRTLSITGKKADGTTTSIGKICLRYVDLVGWSGAVGAVSPSNSTAYFTSARTSFAASLTTEGTSYPIIGVAGVIHGGGDPFTTTGWSQTATIDTGADPDTDTAAVFVTKTGGAAGTVETLTMGFSVSTDDGAIALLELG